MRWILVLVGIFLISFASAVIPTDCEGSVIAYWQMENNLVDIIGGHDGGIWNGSSGYVDLKVGSAASFTGGEKIIIPDAGDLDFNSAFTIEMQVESSGSSDANLFKKGEYEIKWVSGGAVQASVGAVVLTSGSLLDDVVYHVALVWDSSVGNLMLYVNGVNVDEVGLLSSGDANEDLVLGDSFVGLIDEVAIYDSALGEDDILLHYALSNNEKNYCELPDDEGSSSIGVNFNIGGCTFGYNGDSISVPAGKCSIGEVSGEYFCDVDKNPWITREEGYGCSLGSDEYSLGGIFCCPPGMFCNETDSGMFVCNNREENCFDQDSESSCNDAGCIWLDPSEECSDGTRDYSCGYYGNEADCLTDEWSLGKQGIGTELCGTTMECNGGEVFSIPDSDCGCAWYDYAPAGKKCQVKLVGAQMFYNPIDGQDRFECSSFYELDECVDGNQNVTWFSNSSITGGFASYSAVPTDCLDNLGCNGGAIVRACGEPIVKLPGFSLFALFASLGMIGMVYFFRKE